MAELQVGGPVTPVGIGQSRRGHRMIRDLFVQFRQRAAPMAQQRGFDPAEAAVIRLVQLHQRLMKSGDGVGIRHARSLRRRQGYKTL
ncbi:hypothetical protein [Novosphingobium sp.]|uniref:hypothetical protein n=1 Tax=Novosphingobium sp. TaxID=1874826 RepID=UPI0031DD3D58